MPYDYTQAPPARDVELIPHGTIATIAMRIRAGNAGEDGLLKRSAKGDCEMLDLEFVIVDGAFGFRPCDPRHHWQRGSAHGQMQEFPAGKFHSVPSQASSRNWARTL